MPRSLLRFLTIRLAFLLIISLSSLLVLKTMEKKLEKWRFISGKESGVTGIVSGDSLKNDNKALNDSNILALMSGEKEGHIQILEFRNLNHEGKVFKWVRGSGEFPQISQTAARIEQAGFRLESLCLEAGRDKQTRAEVLYFDFIISRP
jgi:hypothetical protein